MVRRIVEYSDRILNNMPGMMTNSYCGEYFTRRRSIDHFIMMKKDAFQVLSSYSTLTNDEE